MQINKPAIKQFIRDSLGCTCPDEVFEDINIEENPGLISDVKKEFILIIGNKLLVYVVEPNEWRLMVNSLKQIFDWGKTRRDAIGLNRFRLVVSTPEIRSAEGILFQSMEAFPRLDEHLHLHVILPQKLPQFML